MRLYGASPGHSNDTLVDGPPLFIVSHSGFDSPTSLSVLDAPSDVNLKLDVRTTNAPAAIALCPAYEGAFHLSSPQNGLPRVDARTGIEDPSGRGRTRVVHTWPGEENDVHGSAMWDPEDGEDLAEKGSVLWVEAVGGEASLDLGIDRN